jgi:glc operon protein GlcG
MKTIKSLLLLTLSVLLLPPVVSAQTEYGSPITLEQARRVMAAAETKARENNWNVAIAIVDTGGHLVLLQRLDQTQFGSIEFARQKAWSAAAFRRSTKFFQDAVAKGGEGLRLLKVEGAIPVEGGLPILVNGKVIGAIGVSGVTSAQDGIIAQAGIEAMQ